MSAYVICGIAFKGLGRSHHLFPIDVKTSGLQLSTKRFLPSAVLIVSDVHHTTEIGWNLNVSSLKSTHARSRELPNKEAQFQDNVLTRSIFSVLALGTAKVIGRKQYNCKPDIRMSLDLLDNGFALACLLMQNDRFKSKSFYKASDRVFRSFIMAMDDENFPGRGSRSS
jgi:hypothetical protein